MMEELKGARRDLCNGEGQLLVGGATSEVWREPRKQKRLTVVGRTCVMCCEWPRPVL